MKLNERFPFAQKSPIIHSAIGGNTFGYDLCFHTNGELPMAA